MRYVWKTLIGPLDRHTGRAAAVCIIIPWPALAAQLHSLVPTRRLLWALGFTVAFAVSARLLRAVTAPGAIAGGVLALLLFIAGGPGAFATLIAVFLLTWIATRMGYRRKRQLGTAEKRSGRSAAQVIANIAIAAAAAVTGMVTGHAPAWLIASAAALAEAAADTTSSEVGQALSESAYLVTDFRRVPVGMDGGISLVGTVAGSAAALLVAAVAWAAHVIASHWLLPIAAAGILGMFVDSFLGATLERRRLLNNNAVNLLGTITAALFALFLYWSRHGEFPVR